MKALGYFIYGFVSALMLIAITFDHTMEIFFDDYYIELFYNEWRPYWDITNITITTLFFLCSMIWIYHQGTSAACEEKLLINKEEKENE